MWQVIPAPSRAATVHTQLLSKMDDLLDIRGLHLDEGQSGPCLVTVVNASRIEADINRDTGCIKGGEHLVLIRNLNFLLPRT